MTRNLDAMEHGIAARVRSGDAEAFSEFVRAHGEQMYLLAFRMTGNAEDAADVRQEAFLRAHRALGSFDGRAALSTWMYRVTLNTCHDYLRKRSSTARHEHAVAQEVSRMNRTSTEGATSPGQEDLAATVIAALDQLPLSQREALVMRHYLGLTFSEIAEIVGEPVTTIKSRVLRGLQRVRDLLESRGIAKEAE